MMDLWQACRNSTLKPEPASHAAILFDKFHVRRHLGEALDTVRKTEYARLTGKGRCFIIGQKYKLLSHRENLTTEEGRIVKLSSMANKRLHTAYLPRRSSGSSGTMSEKAGRCASSRPGALHSNGSA